ncbi:MAG: PepSY domain-containing protein [Gammaproteobacteria bacterium]
MSAVLLACLIALPQAVSADNEGRNRERFRGGGEQPRIDSDRAASIARQKSGGRVLRVRPGRDRHSVKVLSPDGHVYEIGVDPRTGDVR